MKFFIKQIISTKHKSLIYLRRQSRSFWLDKHLKELEKNNDLFLKMIVFYLDTLLTSYNEELDTREKVI